MFWIEKSQLKSVETNPIVKLRPFKILTKIIDLAYRVELSSHWKIHKSFHISLWTPFRGRIPPHPIFKQPLDLVDCEEIVHPEAIIDHEITNTRIGTIYNSYILTFKNHPREDAWCWVPE